MRGFFLILFAGLGCAVLGGAVGWLLGAISPEFIAFIVQPQAVAEPARLGAALGAVSGLLLGSAAMVVGILIGAFRAWLVRGRSWASESLGSQDQTSEMPADGTGEREYAYSERRTK